MDTQVSILGLQGDAGGQGRELAGGFVMVRQGTSQGEGLPVVQPPQVSLHLACPHQPGLWGRV